MEYYSAIKIKKLTTDICCVIDELPKLKLREETGHKDHIL